jgi:hypothetical protein
MSQVSPEAAFRYFIDAFNREDLDALDEAWTSPWSVTSTASQLRTTVFRANDFRSSLQSKLTKSDYFALITFTRCRIALLAPM